VTAGSGRYEVVERVPELARRASLAERSVLVVGCGALGSAVAAHLVRSGVGLVRLVDRDVVEERNLPVQALYTELDATLGTFKAEAAAAHLREVNGDCTVESVVADYAPGNALRLAAGCDLLVDGSDNLETKLLLNDVAVSTGTPLVYAGCAGTEGSVMAVVPGTTHCLRCLWPHPTAAAARATCETRGLLPATATAVAALQFTEALKILLGADVGSLSGLVRLDAWEAELYRVPLPPFPAAEPCPACGDHDLAYLRGRRTTKARELCGDDTVLLSAPDETDLGRVRERHVGNATMRAREDCVHFEVEGCRIVAFASGRTLVHGAGGVERARVLYGRHVVG
jgi:adenylyltransferase/sulfurtransferase